MMRCMRSLLGFVVIGVLLRLASPAHALNIGNPRLVRALTHTDYSSGCSECVPMTDSIAFPSDAYVVIVHESNGMADGKRLEYSFIRRGGSVLSGLWLQWDATTQCWTNQSGFSSCGPYFFWTMIEGYPVNCDQTGFWTAQIFDNAVLVVTLPFMLTRDGAPVAITSPTDNQLVQLLQQTYTASDPVHFSATTSAGGSISWSAALSYQTGAGYPSPKLTDTRTFTTASGVVHDETYQSVGGQVKVTAQTTTSDGSTVTDCATFYVEGPDNIDPNLTTNQLFASYTSSASRSYPSDGTPNLLTGVEMHEATYHQFWTVLSTPIPNEDLFGLYSKFGIAAQWPHESYDKGTHIGLMMVKTTASAAWNWLTNINTGMGVFSGTPPAPDTENKVEAAIRYEGYILNGKPGNPKITKWVPKPRALTGVERENNALVLYRGAGFDGVLRHTLDRLYLIPVCPTGLVQDTNTGHKCVGTDWVWQINDFNQPVGVEYVSFPGSQTTQPGVRYQLQ